MKFQRNSFILVVAKNQNYHGPVRQLAQLVGQVTGSKFHKIKILETLAHGPVRQLAQLVGQVTERNKMLLAFDVGNTNIVLGVFKDGKLLQNWRMETLNSKSADEYGMIINQLFKYENLNIKDVDDVIISTVVPSMLYTLQHMARKYFKVRAIVIGPGIKTGLKIRYDNPEQVGSDRIVNAVAALTKYGGPLVIVDFGTATTFCAITEDWEYLGGSIAPGLMISSDALFEKTAKLPKVELEDPGTALGKNTIQSMQSGLVYGHMGVVERLCEKMKDELDNYSEHKNPIKVVATGGVASMISKGIDCIDIVDKMLTLDGLSIIYEKNKKDPQKRRVKSNETDWDS